MKIEEAIQQKKPFASEWHKLVVNLLYRSHLLQSKLNDGLQTHGITWQQFNILRILKGAQPHPLSVGEIKIRMVDHHCDVSRVVDRLEQKNLLDRQKSAHDFRITEVTISKKGMSTLESIDEDPGFNPRHFLNDLSKADAGALNLLLDGL